MKKFLSIMIVLAMLLSIAPILEVAAADDTTWTKVSSITDIGADDTFAITITVEGTTYVLPVVQSGNNSQSQAIPEITGTVDGNTLTISNTEYTFGWKLIPVEGGYHIKSADEKGYYLYVRASNNGINIYAKDPTDATAGTYLWNVLTCGLLGANSGSKYHTLSIDMSKDGWWTPGTTGGTADGTAYSSARNNELGLWVLNDAHDCADANPIDHKCDICGAVLTQCQDANPIDHKCDTCGAVLSNCSDNGTDGDHKCDICGAENASEHIDADGDKRCDDCNEALCNGAHSDESKDHKCDVCGVVVSECADNEPLDHKCDVCGAVLSQCADADGDQNHNCDICNAEAITECADAAGDNDHLCDECGKADITAHTWVDATIEAPKTCTECGATEGDPLPLSPTPEGAHWTKVESLADIAEGEKFAITITIDGVTYILPNADVPNSSSAPNLDLQGVISEDGRFLTTEGAAKNCNFTVVPAEGGYYIKSGSNYLWVAPGDTGLRISETDAPTVWNVLDVCKLLGSTDEKGNTRTMCIRDGLWKSFKVGADGRAHSTVRNNVLGLWKYVPAANEPDTAPPTGDMTVSIVFAAMLISGLGIVALIPGKKF